jgi:hypothetical protein
MIQAKHTPGPWFLVGDRTLYVEAKIGGGLVQEVAAVGPTAADNGYGQQQVANANLIASAPALYEALANLENDAGQIPDHAWKMVQSALAKARGES